MIRQQQGWRTATARLRAVRASCPRPWAVAPPHQRPARRPLCSTTTSSDTEALLGQIQPGAGPLEAYSELVRSGALREDAGQAAAMAPLQLAFEKIMAAELRTHTLAEPVAEDEGDGVTERRDFAGLQSAFDGISGAVGFKKAFRRAVIVLTPSLHRY